MNSFLRNFNSRSPFILESNDNERVLVFSFELHKSYTAISEMDDRNWLDYIRKVTLKDGENCAVGRVYDKNTAKYENLYFESTILEPLHAKFYYKNNKVRIDRRIKT